jgi:hypothetical protein
VENPGFNKLKMMTTVDYIDDQKWLGVRSEIANSSCVDTDRYWIEHMTGDENGENLPTMH